MVENIALGKIRENTGDPNLASDSELNMNGFQGLDVQPKILREG